MNNLSDILIRWYQQHGRCLPWRQTQDPYRIWISEVILQQTRVAQGEEYYHRFIGRFADVRTLASASEEQVLKMWQGLGYYSRARNLHAAAQQIVNHFGGIFPDQYTAIRSLHGVGEYTAAAICSFAYNLPYPALDGNVYRVLSRLFDIEQPLEDAATRKTCYALASQLLNPQQPGLHNQAIMEFGALQCLPKGYICEQCPLEERCLARLHGTTEQRPVKRAKTPPSHRYFNYLDLRINGMTLLCRRSNDDIWKNLYEFPLIETSQAVDFSTLQRHPQWKQWFENTKTISLTRDEILPPHILSHRIIHSRFYVIELTQWPEPLQDFLLVAPRQIDHYPVSRLIERYLERRAEK